MAQPERRVGVDPRPHARRRAPARPAGGGRRHGAAPDGARRRRLRSLQPARVAAGPRVRPRSAPARHRPAARRARCASCSTPSRGSTRTPTTGPVRCGRCTSSTGWRAGAPRRCGRSTTPSPTARAPARLSELFIQPTRDAPMPPPVDLPAVIAAAVAADAEATAADRPSVVESVLGTATHLARRQAGIAKRLAGEMAMWGADPRRARDTIGARPARSASSATRSPAAAGRRRRTTRATTAGAPRRLAAVAQPLAPPPPRGHVVPARRRAGGGEGPRGLAERLVRHRRRQRRRRLPRRARRAAAHAEHELRRQHAGRQGDRRQLVHAEPVQRTGGADGPGRSLQAAQRDDGRSGARRSPAPARSPASPASPTCCRRRSSRASPAARPPRWTSPRRTCAARGAASTCRAPASTSRTRSGRSPARRST